MAGQLPRHRRSEGVRARLRALPHADAARALAPRRQRSSRKSSSAWRVIRRSPSRSWCSARPRHASAAARCNPERQQQAWRRQAEYLSTLNLSSGPQWSYTFKTLPRPKGAATRVIYTEYDLPRAHAAAARRDRRFAGHGVVRRASANRFSAGSIRRPARRPNGRSRC